MNKNQNWRRILTLICVMAMLVGILVVGSVVAFAADGEGEPVAQSSAVAKVGSTEYTTIDEAIANWTNGSTLTLLADVTLSDVIKLSSTEHHILDLGTYTMTAASKKDAIEIVNNGRTSASYALDIKADATNPGGITASGKAVVKTTGKSGVKDRPIIRFYGGVFTGTNVVYHSGSNGTNCPQFWFYGGEFNGTVYANRALFQFYGGTFNGALQISVDSSAYALISGGKFAKLSNQYGSALNSDKFTIGSAKGNYNRSIYVDKDGYYVVTSEVITEVSAKYPAVKKETYNSNNYFYYSAAATYGMFYEVASMAGTGSNVTIWEKPLVNVIVSENVTGDTTVIEEIKNSTVLNGYKPQNLPTDAVLNIELESVGDKIVYDVTPVNDAGEKVETTKAITFCLPVPASVTDTHAKVYHDGETEAMGIFKILGEENSKYIELSSADFSEFAVETVTPTKGYYLTIYNADGTVGMTLDGTKSGSAFCLKTAIEDARVFVNNAFLFGIQTPATYVVEMFEDSTENKSFEIKSDVTINGNGHKIVLAPGVELTNNGTLNNVTVDKPVVVAKIGDTYYATLEEAFAAAQAGQTIVLLADATPALTSQRAITAAAVIDLNGKTLTLTKGDLYFGTTTFQNGTIVVDSNVFASTAVFWMFENQTLTFNGVELVATGVTGTYLIGINGGTGTEVKILNSKLTIDNASTASLTAVICDNGTGNSVVIDNSTLNVKNIEGRVYLGGTNGSVTVTNSTLALNGVKEGFYLRAGQTLAIEGNSNVTIVLNTTEGRYGINVTDMTANYTKAESATVDATVYEIVPAAMIGTVKYATLQAAINAVKNGETIVLTKDLTENVTLTEKTGLYYTIDGDGKNFNGTMTISSLSDTNDNRRITIKNVNFVTTEGRDFITSVETNHYPRLTVEACSFTGTGKANADTVAIRLKSSHSVVIKDCTGTGLHSFLQNTSGWNLTVENVTVTDSKSGLALGTVQGVTVKDCNIAVDGYGIRLDTGYNNNAVLESNTISAFIPVVVRKASVDSNVTVQGTNTFIATNNDGIWLAIGTSEYETNGTMPSAATAKVIVTLNDSGLSAAGVYGDYYVAKIGDVKYQTLADAFAALTEGDTLVIAAGTYTEGTIKLPANLKNVTIKGEGAILKDMTISAADGNSYSYVGLTFDGLTFDNSRLIFTGWRNDEEVIENLTITNCVFKNLYDTTNNAPVHINKDAAEAVKGFTFTNNVIDGATGGSKSGIYLQATGNVTITNNVINNVSFRPYVIQITTDDGIADNFVVTGNTFSGSAAGRAQGLGNNAAGTDTVYLVVSGNIFKGITESQQICYWNFNAEKTTADLSKNYYDIDVLANPSRIYFNSAAQNASDLVEMGIFPIYTELNADGTINRDILVEAPAIMVTYPVGNPVYPEGKVEYYNDILEAVPYTTNCPRLEGATITLLRDVSGAGLRFMENDMIFDLNGHTFTITAGTGSQGTNTSGFQIRPEVTTNVIFKNGTIKVAEGAPVVWMFNCYATDFIVENVTIDCTNMAWSYGESCYVVVSRSGDNVQFTGTTEVKNFNSNVAGVAYSVGGTMTVGENVVLGGSVKLDASATLTAPTGVEVVTADGYVVVYKNGVYSTAQALAQIGDVQFATLAEALNYAEAEGITDLVITLIGDTTKESALALEDTFNLCYATKFDSVTFKQADSSKVYYIDSLYTGKRTNNGKFTFYGVNIHVTGQYMLEGNVVLTNNSVITSSAEANCFFYSCSVTVEPGSMIKGVIEDFRGGDAIIDGGRTDGNYNDTPSFQDAILIINWSGDSLVIKNGAYVKINSANEVGRITINSGAYIEVLDSLLESVEYITVNGELRLNIGSLVNTKKITGNGKIIIDATNFSGAALQLIKADMSGFTGTIEIVGNNKVEYAITDDGIMIKAKPVAKIGDTYYTSLEEAFKAATEGCVIDILADVTVDSAWDCRYNGAKFLVSVTINGNGHTIKFTGTVNDGNWNTIFRFEENAVVNNLTIDISEATGCQRVITAKKSLTVDGLTIIGAAKYGIIFGEGATDADRAAAEIVIKNSTLTGTRRAISDNEGGKDVKSVVVTGNTLNANVYLSASESIVFNNNTANGEVDLRSYAKSDSVLSVEAQGNTLKAGVKNYIHAKTINAQSEFTTEYPPYKVSTKAELNAALAAAKDGDTIILTADIDYGTDQLAITKAITLDLGDNTLTTRNAYGGISVKNNATIKNGTIVHASNTAAIKVWNATAFEDLVIDVQGKGDANKTIGGIVLQSGSTTRVGSIKNVTIKGAALTNGIETYNCGDATENVIGSLENVTIDAVGTGMLISAPVGTATNCNIKGGTNAIEIWIKGTYSASLELVNSTVTGGVYAHDEFSSNPGVVNNGTLSLTTSGTTNVDADDITLVLARAENVAGLIKDVKDNAEAKVNDTYYATLADAFAAAQADDVVTVFAGTYAMPSMKAGLTLVGEGEVVFEGTLTGTLENLTLKNIHIKGGNAQRWAYAKGDLVFENVTFEATGVYALHFDGITAGATLTYKDCTIIGWAAMSGSPASATFEGCTFKGNGTYGVIRVYFDATIKNCTFDVANVNTTDEYQDGIHAVEGAKVTVTGCTNVNGDMKDVVNVSGTSTVVLDGVEIKNVAKIGDTYYATLADAFAAAQNGDEVKILVAGTYALSTSGKNITVTGAVDGVVFDNIGAKNMGGASVTFNNVTFNYATNSTYKGLQHSGNLVYNDCTFNGQVFLYGTSETFNNCTFNTTDSNNYNVWTYGAKEVAFNGCTFNSAGKSVLIYSESASVSNNVTVADCTFKASQAVDGKAAIEMDSSLSGAINLTITNTTATGFGNGNVSGNSLWNNKKGNNTDANNDITVVVNGTTVLAPVTFVAKIGNVGYTTLQAAINAAQADDVVTVLAGTYAMPSMKAGLTLVGEGEVVFEGTLTGTLENLTLKNIHIKGGNAQRWAYAKGNLVFENVTFEATSVYALHFDGITAGATLLYKNCTIIGWAAMSGSPASATFEGCTFKGNGAYGVIRVYFDATIKNCTFDVANVNTTDEYQDGIHAVEGAKVTVTGCTNVNGDMEDIVNVKGTSVVVLDGVEIKNVAKIGDNYYATLADAFAAAQNGDEVEILVAGTYALSTSGKNITVTGVVDGVVFDNIGAKNMGGANVTFNNVTFNYATNSTYKGLQHSGNLVYNNCTFNGQVFLYGTSETFNNCTFNTTDSNNYNVWTYGAKEVAFNECTFNSAGKSVLIYSESASVSNNVTVADCTFVASSAVEGKAAIEMDSSLSGAINLTITNTTATGFGNGNVSGNSLWNNKKGNNTDANNDITVVVNGTTVLAPVTFVAKIGNVGYTTLQAAINAAQAGETVTLLADIEASEVLLIGKSLTINGNGRKVTSSATRVFRVTASNVEVTLNDVNMVSTKASSYIADIRGISIDASLTNVKLTLNNCSVDFTDASACDWAYAVNVSGNGTGHTLTINGGTYEGANVINVHGANNTVVVKNATLNCTYPNSDMYAGACIWVLQNQGSSVEATGNTFNGANAIAFNLGTGTTLTESNNTDNTTLVVAKIGNTYYTTLADAIAAAQVGETVTLLDDVTLDAVITIEKAITLDLNGKTVTGASGAVVFNVKASTTIKNGAILGSKSGTSSGLIDIYADLTMDGVTVQTSKINALAFKVGGCTATLTNCDVTGAFKGYGASVWNIVSGTYKASSTSISKQINGTATIYGGTFYYTFDEAQCAPGYAIVDNGDGTYGVVYAPVGFVDANNNGALDEGELVFASLEAVFKTYKTGDVYIVLTNDVVINTQVDTTVNAKYYLNTNVADGVTVEFAFADDWNYVQKMYVGENVTIKAPYLLVWTDLDLYGTIDTTYLYITTADVLVAEGAVVNANTGEATVQVKNGATLTVNGVVNTAILNVWAGESKLIVDGANAQVNAKWVDIWDGTPSVSIQDGATLNVEKIKVSRGGTIAVTDATLDATTIEVGHNGESAGVLTETGNSTINGTIKLTATGSVVNSDGGLNVTTDIADHKVVFENGQYKVVENLYVAEVNGVKYETVLEALKAAIENGASELKILCDVREKMTSDFDFVINADLTITADAPVKVEFFNVGKTYDFAVGSTNNNTLTIGENVHFDLTDRVIWIGYYGNNVDVVVDGYLGGYQIWHGADTTVSATGTLDSHGEAFIMRRNATLTVDGGKVNANYFQIYSGHIVAENATITAGLVWINNNHSYGSEGTVSFALDNTIFTSRGVVEVYAGEGKKVTITLTNDSEFTAAGKLTLGNGTSVAVDDNSSFNANNKIAYVAQVSNMKYTSFEAAYDAVKAGVGDKAVLLTAIRGAALNLGSDIGIYYFIEESAIVGNGYVAVIKNAAKEIVARISFDDWKHDTDKKAYLVLFDGLAAKQMTEEFTIEIIADDGTVFNSATTSVKTYVERGVENGIFSSEKAQKLIAALLNYGTQAENYFTGSGSANDGVDLPYITDTPTTETLSEDPAAVGDSFYVTSSVNTEHTIQFNFKFTAAGLENADKAVFTYAGKTVTVVKDDFFYDVAGRLVVTLENIDIRYYDKAITCTILDANGDKLAEATDSILNYCTRAINGNNDKYATTEDKKYLNNVYMYSSIIEYGKAVAEYNK